MSHFIEAMDKPGNLIAFGHLGLDTGADFLDNTRKVATCTVC